MRGGAAGAALLGKGKQGKAARRKMRKIGTLNAAGKQLFICKAPLQKLTQNRLRGIMCAGCSAALCIQLLCQKLLGIKTILLSGQSGGIVA